jgi:hypothetical protein
VILSVRKPFGIAALAWAVIGVAVCRIFAPSSSAFFSNLLWMTGLYCLSLCDLIALGKTVQGVLSIAASASADPKEGSENRAHRAIQTFYWAILKLACLGIFVGAMVLVSREGKSIPTPGLLAGVGTVAMVPLLGGLFWSRISNE